MDALAMDCGTNEMTLRKILKEQGARIKFSVADRILCGLDMPHLWFEDDSLREIYFSQP